MGDDHLRDILVNGKSSEAEAARDDPETLTIAEMSGATLPRPANKLLTRLHVMLKTGQVHSFVYHHLDSNSTFDSDGFTLTFIGAKHWQVTVKGHGKDLWRAYDYITLFRWPFLAEATRDFGGKAETVFTSIKITDVTPKQRDIAEG